MRLVHINCEFRTLDIYLSLSIYRSRKNWKSQKSIIFGMNHDAIITLTTLITKHPRLTTLSRPETWLHTKWLWYKDSNIFLKIKALIKYTMNWVHLGHPFIRSSPRPRDNFSCCRSFESETVTTCYMFYFTAGIKTLNLPHAWWTFFRTENRRWFEKKTLFHLQKQIISDYVVLFICTVSELNTFVIYIAKLDICSSIPAKKKNFFVKKNHLLWLDISVYKPNLASDTTHIQHWRRQNRSAWTAVNSHAFFSLLRFWCGPVKGVWQNTWRRPGIQLVQLILTLYKPKYTCIF